MAQAAVRQLDEPPQWSVANATSRPLVVLWSQHADGLRPGSVKINRAGAEASGRSEGRSFRHDSETARERFNEDTGTSRDTTTSDTQRSSENHQRNDAFAEGKARFGMFGASGRGGASSASSGSSAARDRNAENRERSHSRADHDSGYSAMSSGLEDQQNGYSRRNESAELAMQALRDVPGLDGWHMLQPYAAYVGNARYISLAWVTETGLHPFVQNHRTVVKSLGDARIVLEGGSIEEGRGTENDERWKFSDGRDIRDSLIRIWASSNPALGVAHVARITRTGDERRLTRVLRGLTPGQKAAYFAHMSSDYGSGDGLAHAFDQLQLSDRDRSRWVTHLGTVVPEEVLVIGACQQDDPDAALIEGPDVFSELKERVDSQSAGVERLAQRLDNLTVELSELKEKAPDLSAFFPDANTLQLGQIRLKASTSGKELVLVLPDGEESEVQTKPGIAAIVRAAEPHVPIIIDGTRRFLLGNSNKFCCGKDTGFSCDTCCRSGTCNGGSILNCQSCMDLDVKRRGLPRGWLVNASGKPSRYVRHESGYGRFSCKEDGICQCSECCHLTLHKEAYRQLWEDDRDT
ncbi:hypothetical protein DFJ74DRAFT_11596 [Hyaloraphidium curvatum]|nr:hypothetical protein DFJ74DRAFT_11596 [Hyaloraphidium curvatum]